MAQLPSAHTNPRGIFALVALLVLGSAFAANLDSQLFDAIEAYDLGRIRVLLADGADVNARGPGGQTPLIRAISVDAVYEDEYLQTIRALLNDGADVNAQDERGLSALQHAAIGHTGWGSLTVNGTLTMVGPPGGRAVLEAVYIQVVRELLSRGAIVDQRMDKGGTALMAAAVAGYSDIMGVLLKAGADIDATTYTGVTALMSAVEGGHAGAVRYLIRAGADVNVISSHGANALRLAVNKGDEEIVRLLRDAESEDLDQKLDALYAEATTLLNDRNYEEAIVRFTELVRLVPMSSMLYAQRGYAYLQTGENELCIADSTKAIELSTGDAFDPPPEVPLINRGTAYANVQQLDRAIADFTRAIELDPKKTQAYMNLSAAHYQLGDIRRAVQTHEDALAAGVDSPQILNEVAWICAISIDAGICNVEKTVEYAERAVEGTKGLEANYLDTLAEAYMVSGQRENAVQAIEKAIELDPDNPYYQERLQSLVQ